MRCWTSRRGSIKSSFIASNDDEEKRVLCGGVVCLCGVVGGGQRWVVGCCFPFSFLLLQLHGNSCSLDANVAQVI
jgi:hypothetical protein